MRACGRRGVANRSRACGRRGVADDPAPPPVADTNDFRWAGRSGLRVVGAVARRGRNHRDDPARAVLSSRDRMGGRAVVLRLDLRCRAETDPTTAKADEHHPDRYRSNFERGGVQAGPCGLDDPGTSVSAG